MSRFLIADIFNGLTKTARFYICVCLCVCIYGYQGGERGDLEGFLEGGNDCSVVISLFLFSFFNKFPTFLLSEGEKICVPRVLLLMVTVR